MVVCEGVQPPCKKQRRLRGIVGPIDCGEHVGERAAVDGSVRQ